MKKNIIAFSKGLINMKKSVKGILIALVMAVALLFGAAFSASALNEDSKWITAWSTAPTEIGIEGYDNITAYIGNVTSRTVITPTANGSKLRIRVTNVYGDSPMKLTRVTVAKSLGGSKIDPDTIKIVTFNEGHPFVSVPAGQELLSDPVTYDVKAGEDIAISIFIEDFTEIKTMGLSGGETSIALDGDYTSKPSMDIGTMFDAQEVTEYLSKILGGTVDLQLAFSFVDVVPCLASVDVLADENAYSVVVVGDSTVSNEFPEYLAQAINAQGITNVGVAGKGIIGNRLLGDGLGFGSLIYGESLIDRFQRDVLSQSGVEYVVIKIGANDIIHPVCNDIVEKYPDIEQPTWQEICLGYRKLFQMCHNAGIKVVALSITPWKGTTRDYFGTGPKYVRTDAEFNADWAIAQKVNQWLATTDEHDGFFDLNAFSTNPKDTAAFYPEYTIDGIHPSDIMQKMWVERFPLSCIGVGKTVAGLRLDKTSASAYVGTKGTLKANVFPATATNKSVVWTSSNPSVVKVNTAGQVECLAPGEAVITCITQEGGYKATCKIKVYAKPVSVKLDKTSATVYTTQSGTLKATVLPADAYDKSVTWSSSNKKVATVDKNGKVTAVGSGTAVITVKTNVGGATASFTIRVLKKTEVIGIALNSAGGKMLKGNTYQLKYELYPENATFRNVTWSSSNPKVVSVDRNGLIKAITAGSAVITCRSKDNPMVYTTCNIVVVVATTGVTLNATKGSVYAGYSGTLKAKVYPSDATDQRVTWSSSNKAVATVDKNGKVTGVKPGTAVITCKTVNGAKTASCTVTVKSVVKTTAVKLNRNTGSMYAGTYGQLKATVYPENASIKNVTWSSSDTSVIKVSSSGKVLAVKPGTAVVTCKTVNGGKTATCTIKVYPIKPDKVVLNTAGGSMDYGKTYQLKATVYPENATDKRVTWTSSNPKVVSVSSTGLIKALTPNASAVITCKTVSGGVVATCTVKVKPLKVTGIKLNHSQYGLIVGSTFTLTPTVYPSNASNKAVVWGSSNHSVATVSSKGVVTAKAKGQATIYCRTQDGGYTAYCVVTVGGNDVLGVMLNKASISGLSGSTYQLAATVVPENATNKKVVWSSTDPTIAKVDSTGKVTLVKKGNCQIWVTTVDGNYVASCKVTVF